jgi:nucleotide-binding universal stress UspA family protein
MPDRVVQRILVPVDLSLRETPDYGYAIKLAAQLGAELLLFAVIDTPAMVAMIPQHRAPLEHGASFQRSIVDDAKGILQRIVDQAGRHGVSALGHAVVAEEVEDQILREALVRKVDLIVVRASHRSALMKALTGSTAGEILKAAPCPVLVAAMP